MESSIVDAALHFISAYGLVAIFVLLVLDAAMLLPVFPGEAVLVMAVAAYAHDQADLVFLIVLTAAAGLAGSLVLYGICRGGGRRLVEKYPRLFMMPRRRRERLERMFARPTGQSLVLFLRLVPLTRVLVNIPAGLARMPIVRFVVLSSLGLLAYHAAFLWFAFEVRRPGSSLGTQKEQLQAAYADPAMDFVAANLALSALVLLAVGAVVSVRASRAMLRDPEESTGSLVGWLATMVLLWGGLALGITAYLDPRSMVTLAQAGGLDLAAAADKVGASVTELLSWTAALMVVVGAFLRGLSRQASGRRRRFMHEQRQQRLRGASATAATDFDPDEPPAPRRGPSRRERLANRKP